jgi:TadE-like protein
MAPHRNIGRGAQSGQSLVEFALILPLVLVLTLGIVDAARIFSSWIALNSGVGEASLYASTSVKLSHWCMDPTSPLTPPGSVGCPAAGTVPGAVDALCGLVSGTAGNYCPNPDNIAYRVKVEASGLDASRLIMVAPACMDKDGATIACGPAAAYVTIGASYDMDLLTPLVSNFMGHPVHMSAAATAPIIAP